MRGRLLTLCTIAAAVLGLAPASPAMVLRLIGVRTLPARMIVQGTTVSGLSGLDYDAAADRWLAISDDKVEQGPARFYAVKLDYDDKRFATVEITGVTMLREPDSGDYPDKARFRATRRGEVPDFESLRLDPRDGGLWYSSEGDRGLGLNPFVRHAARDGSYLGDLPLPPMFAFSAERELGPRHNLAFEGLSFAPDGESLWVAMEGPLYQDGPPPSAETGALTRFTRFARDGRILRQFAYPVDPLPVRPLPGRLADNGVSEILALEDGRLFVLERAGWQDQSDVWHFAAKLFAVDTVGASDTSAVPALADRRVSVAAKRSVFDFSSSGQPRIDNLECLAWGRRLPNGHASLVVASDDNFSATQETQFWVFDVSPEARSSPP